jgi:tyrosinase
VSRAPGTAGDLALIASNTSAALAPTTFNSFTAMLEGIHDSVHVWVGGTMGVIATAPADPIFWMHPCKHRSTLVEMANDAGQCRAGKNPP